MDRVQCHILSYVRPKRDDLSSLYNNLLFPEFSQNLKFKKTEWGQSLELPINVLQQQVLHECNWLMVYNQPLF
jgi:hypothetical protein